MTAHIRARANSYNFIIAFFVGLGSFTYGFDSAIVGSVIGLPSFYSYFNFEYTSSYGSSIIGANNGVYAGGGAIGCWIVNWLSDKLGRRLAIQLIAALCIISAAIQTGSVHIAMFLVGRFLNGVAVGMINCTVPTYISEIAPAAQRGLLVGAHGICICASYVRLLFPRILRAQIRNTDPFRAFLDGSGSEPISKQIRPSNGDSALACKSLHRCYSSPAVPGSLNPLGG